MAGWLLQFVVRRLSTLNVRPFHQQTRQPDGWHLPSLSRLVDALANGRDSFQFQIKPKVYL